MTSLEKLLLSTGHGKELGGQIVCGLKDICDVIKNIFAVGTLTLSCVWLALGPVVAPKLYSAEYLYWVGIIGAILLIPLLIFLFKQLYYVVEHMPFLRRGNNTTAEKGLALACSLGTLLGVILGIISMFVIALHNLQV